MELIGRRDATKDNVYLVRDPQQRCEKLCRVYQNVRGDQTLDEYADELALIKDLKHPRLTQVDEVRASEDGFAIFYANYAGTLKEKCQQNDNLTEEEAAFYFRQVLEVIKYCHDENVSLGANIQLVNFVFDTKSDDILRLDVLKQPHDVSYEPLAYTSENKFHPFYVPPEATPQYWDTYDPLKADSWCAGTLLYEMITGRTPFGDETADMVTRRICHQRLSLPSNISESLKSLLHMLLNKKWESRISIENALLHPWIRNATRKSRKQEETIQTLFA